jgi:molybdenum cofactor synthesis domain-containing protein
MTISDRAARGIYQDKSGPLLVDIVNRRSPWTVDFESTVSDSIEEISLTLMDWCELGANLILTTGGTGVAPSDVTPEATRMVIEKETPGIAEALRAKSLEITKHAMLSRAVSGIRGHTLIINLPGNPKAVKEQMDVLLPILPHALELLIDSSDSERGHRVV